MPIKADREYRNLVLEVKEEEGLEEQIVNGYASTFDEPYELYRMGDYLVREVVDKDAFKNCDMSDVIFQYDHEGRVFARKSNGTLTVEPDDHGLYIEANLGGTTIGRQLYEEIKGGYTSKMSFGFIVSDDKIDEHLEDGMTVITRTITGISKLFDVSAVSLPANNYTEISARKFGDGVIAELEAERLKAHELELRKRRIELIARFGKD